MGLCSSYRSRMFDLWRTLMRALRLDGVWIGILFILKEEVLLMFILLCLVTVFPRAMPY
jgi:hypothetical protein